MDRVLAGELETLNYSLNSASGCVTLGNWFASLGHILWWPIFIVPFQQFLGQYVDFRKSSPRRYCENKNTSGGVFNTQLEHQWADDQWDQQVEIGVSYLDGTWLHVCGESDISYRLLLRKEQDSPSILWAFMQKTSNTSAGNGLALWGLRAGANDRASSEEHLEVHQEWWCGGAFTLGLHIHPASDQSRGTVSMCSHSLLLWIAWLTGYRFLIKWWEKSFLNW